MPDIVTVVRYTYLASLERQARILDRILKVAVPKLTPLLSPVEAAALLALQLAVSGFLAQNPIPDNPAFAVHLSGSDAEEGSS